MNGPYPIDFVVVLVSDLVNVVPEAVVCELTDFVLIKAFDIKKSNPKFKFNHLKYIFR